MRRRLAGLLAAMTVMGWAAAWAQGLPPAVPEAVGLSTPRVERLRSFMQDAVDRHEIAGTVVVVARDGKVAAFDPVGWMDVEQRLPMRKDTIFRMASMTKAVTSVAAVMLMEEGKLRLADPVSRFLPAFKTTTVVVPGPAGSGRYGTVPARREITIRDLLTHTSGISYGNGPAEAAYKSAGLLGWYLSDRTEPVGVLMERPLPRSPASASSTATRPTCSAPSSRRRRG